MTSWFRCAPCGVRSALHDLLTTSRAFALHLVFGAALLAVVFAMGLAAPRAQAQIHVDADANGASDGSSWTDAYTDLQDALSAATGTDQIWIAAGTYTPTVPLDGSDARTATFYISGDQDGLTIYGGFAGTETALSERDLVANETLLSGDLNGDDTSGGDNSENAYHVLVFDGGNGIGTDVEANITGDTVLDGVTVSGGNANSGFPDSAGGGLFCDGQGSSNGTGNVCSLRIRGSIFTGNSADFGGAILNNGISGGKSSPQITGALFTGNTADSGGAIYNFGFGGESSPQIISATFSGNSADNFGDAIHNDGEEGASSTQITNTILWGNGASGSDDEIYNNEASPTLSYTLIEGGQAGISDNNGSSTTYDASTNLEVAPDFVGGTDPAGSDGTLGTVDDGLRLLASSPALDAGTMPPYPVASPPTSWVRIVSRTAMATASPRSVSGRTSAKQLASCTSPKTATRATTALRLIAIRSLCKARWTKLVATT